MDFRIVSLCTLFAMLWGASALLERKPISSSSASSSDSALRQWYGERDTFDKLYSQIFRERWREDFDEAEDTANRALAWVQAYKKRQHELDGGAWTWEFEIRLQLARIAQDRGATALAERSYEALLEMFDGHPPTAGDPRLRVEVLALLAEIRLERGDPALALELVDWLAERPETVEWLPSAVQRDAVRVQALAEIKLGRLDEARRTIDRLQAIPAFPHEAPAKLWVESALLSKLGEHEQAVERAKQAHEIIVSTRGSKSLSAGRARAKLARLQAETGHFQVLDPAPGTVQQ